MSQGLSRFHFPHLKGGAFDRVHAEVVTPPDGSAEKRPLEKKKNIKYFCRILQEVTRLDSFQVKTIFPKKFVDKCFLLFV